MSRVLALASDFIERMSNPAYGIRVNEDYALRFAALLSSDGFDGLMREEVTQLQDPETLSAHGWLWLLNWARSKEMSLNGELLLQLTTKFTNVFMQVAVIDLATRRADWARRETIPPLEKFDHPWLSNLLHGCTYVPAEDEMEVGYVDTRRAETILTALMQVGSDIALDAASALLNHDWIGRSSLQRFFWSLCDELDDETRAHWISRLHPPRE